MNTGPPRRKWSDLQDYSFMIITVSGRVCSIHDYTIVCHFTDTGSDTTIIAPTAILQYHFISTIAIKLRSHAHSYVCKAFIHKKHGMSEQFLLLVRLCYALMNKFLTYVPDCRVSR